METRTDELPSRSWWRGYAPRWLMVALIGLPLLTLLPSGEWLAMVLWLALFIAGLFFLLTRRRSRDGRT